MVAGNPTCSCGGTCAGIPSSLSISFGDPINTAGTAVLSGDRWYGWVPICLGVSMEYDVRCRWSANSNSWEIVFQIWGGSFTGTTNYWMTNPFWSSIDVFAVETVPYPLCGGEYQVYSIAVTLS